MSAGLAVLFVGCWSSGFIGAKLGAAEAAVPTVLMWRFLPLAALLVPLAVVDARRRGSVPPRGALGRHAVIGLLSQSGYLLTVYGAIGLGVSTGTTALIDGVQPLVAAALVGPLLGIAVSGRQWVGLGVGLAGVTVVSWTDATSPATHAPGWAYLVPLAGMLALIASTFLERRARVLTPPLQALTIHCTTSALVLSAIALAAGAATPPGSRSFWLATAWLVVLPTFGGYGLYWILVERIGVTPVNSLMFLIAPVTTVWGALMFGEPLTLATTVGLSLALVGALVGGLAPRACRAAGHRDRGPRGHGAHEQKTSGWGHDELRSHRPRRPLRAGRGRRPCPDAGRRVRGHPGGADRVRGRAALPGDRVTEELVPGRLTGFRLFEVGEDRLTPPFRGGSWTHPETSAWCGKRRHRAPDPACTCGLHAWYAAEDALAHLGRSQAVAVVAASGELVLEEQGFRAERMEVLAVALPSKVSATDAYRERVRRATQATFPGAAVVDGPRQLRRDWPADDLTALGVTGRHTGLATHGPRAAIGWLLGALALWSLVAWPDSADSALREGWWIPLVAALVAWKAWVVTTSVRALR